MRSAHESTRIGRPYSPAIWPELPPSIGDCRRAISGYDTGLPNSSNGPKNCGFKTNLAESFPITPDAHVLLACESTYRDIAGVPSKELFVSALVKELVEAGVHYGHRASRWNPKMRPYIYARKNLIHIIDVRETVRGLLRAKKYLVADLVARQPGAVRRHEAQAGDAVAREAERCGMPYVNDRWLGGTLTNFRTIRSRLTRLEELEGLKGDEAKFDTYSKKMQSALNREYRKMFRNLNGIRTMNRLPECLVIVDPKKEKNAVSEAQKLGIATVALDRHRLRSGRGRFADPRQRRQHAIDRAGGQDAVRRDRAGKNKAAVESQHAAEGAEVAMA